jgi:hypothetical protein
MTQTATGESSGLAETVKQLRDGVREQKQVSIQDVLHAFAGRGFGPILVLIGLIVVTPLGAIPTVPTIMAVLLFLIAIQRLIGRRRPWIPRQLRERSVDQHRLIRALDKAQPWARRVDYVIKPRLTFLFGPVIDYVLAAIGVLLALLMPPLEFIPFAGAIPGLATLMLGLALTAHDGLLALFAVVLTTATLAAGCHYFFV